MRYGVLAATAIMVHATAFLPFAVHEPAVGHPAIRVSTDSVPVLLPAGSLVVDVMELRAPPRFAELLAHLQAAAQTDPEWWQAHAASGAPGQPLPYDERMGLSATEYAEMLELAGRMILVKQGQASVTVSHTPERAVRLDGGSLLPELSGIEFTANGTHARTPLGELQRTEDVQQDDPASPTGVWRGLQWKGEELDAAGRTERTVTLALGRREADGRGILYYTGKVFESGRVTKNVMRVLYFDVQRVGR